MSFSWKYIAKMFSLKRFLVILVSECILKLIFFFCESCKESKSGICFTYALSSQFLITMHGIDKAAEVYLEPFQTL